MAEYRFIVPLDVLYLRGNRLFGSPGDHGEALMPPWPSVAAGALRARMLADAGITELERYRERAVELGPLEPVLGWPDAPGSFRLSTFTLARRARPGDPVEALWPLPADLVPEPRRDRKNIGAVHRLEPAPLPPGVETSLELAQAPLLRATRPFKPAAGWWLCAAGLEQYLRGGVPDTAQHVPERRLWRLDRRLGIALAPDTATAAESRIYTAETVAMSHDGEAEVGFLAGVEGATGCLPARGLLRLGGDGRAAALCPCEPVLPQTDLEAVARDGRLRLVLATPGLFADGWRLPGLAEDGSTWRGPDGMRARLVAAAVPRPRVISGWDLARWRPKPALRAAPSGSVYWLDRLEGDAAALDKLAAEGLWAISDYPDRQRRAEGFNHVLIAAWPRH